MSKRGAPLLAMVVLVVACGASDAKKLVAHAPTAATATACAESAQALCTRAQTCSPMLVPAYFGSFALCASEVAAACEATYSGPGSGDAPSCATAAAVVACEDLAQPTPFITATGLVKLCPVMPGAFAEGASCLEDGDCASGACNRIADCSQQPCVYGCGRCLGPPATEGQSCDPPVRCAPGLVCGFLSPRAPVAAQARVCTRAARLGQACSETEPCAGGAFMTACVPTSKATGPSESVCVDRDRPEIGGAGAPCSSGTSCALAEGLSCGPEHSCAPLVLAGVGSACTDAPFGFSTAPTCDATGRCANGTCVPIGHLGDPCFFSTSFATCGFGLSCDSETSRCVMRQTLSRSCEE